MKTLMPRSPTELTLEALRKDGYTAQVTEHRVPVIHILRDLFGFIDVLGLRPGETLGVQCTSRANVSSRMQKIADHELFPRVLEAGWTVEVWGWDKYKGRYRVRRERM